MRVINAASRELAKVRSEADDLRRALNAAQATSAGLGAARTGGLEKFGKNLQWTGRQIEYNFTLPLVAAGAAAVHFSNQNAAAMTRVVKVYGDGSDAANKMAQQDLPKLQRAFIALSDITGISQQEITNLAADWAAAGATGVGLARATRLTAEAMILGEMSASDASKALIAIQAQYNLTTGEINRNEAALKKQAATSKDTNWQVKTLADTVAVLNAVENQTGATFEGLVQGFSKAAGVARTTGVGVRQLAALIATLTPAAGSAAQAGNGLRTILARLFKPTSEASAMLKQIGIDTNSLSWNSKNAGDRLIELSKNFDKLNAAQKSQLATAVGSVWQLNRFEQVMRDLNNQNSYYYKALKATDSEAKVQLLYLKEVNTVLRSQPNLFKILTTHIQNALSQAIVPFIPAILALINGISRLADMFANLDPGLQKLILFGLTFLALVGPLIRYLGAFVLLFTSIGKGVRFLAGGWVRLLILWERTSGVVKFVTAVITDLGSALFWLATEPIAFLYKSTAFAIGGMAKMWGKFASTVIGQTVVQAFTYAWTFMRTFFVTTAAAAFDWAVAMGSAFIGATSTHVTARAVSGLASMWTAFAAFFSRTYALAGVWVSNMLAALSTWVQASLVLVEAWAQRVLIQPLITAFTISRMALAGGLASMTTTLMGFFRAGIAPFVTGVIAAIDTMVTTVVFYLQTMFTWMVTTMSTGLAPLLAFWRRLWLQISYVVGLNVRLIVDRLAAAYVAMVAFMTSPGKWLPALKRGLTAVVGLFRALPAALTSPWVAAIVAIIALIVAFRRQILGAFKSMIDGIKNLFHSLPQSIQNAFIAVIRVIANAAKSVREWLSEISPFKRHSPSVVDNVNKGAAVIGSGMQTIANHVQTHTSTAASALANFNTATAGARQGLDAAALADTRKKVVAAAPNAGPQFDAVASSITNLKSLLPPLEAEIAKQTAVVNRWKTALDNANDTLDAATKVLDHLKDVASKASDTLDASKQKLQDFADTPIAGMKAMEDQIFANDLAQKKLQLQIMKLADAGQSIDDLRTKYQNLQGDIETLRGTEAQLRAGGAGSDILKTYDDMIAGLTAQQKAIENQTQPIQDLQNQLDALNKAGQELDLEKSINFDPLTKQIQDMTSAAKEMPFDQIVAGIKATQVEVNKNQIAYDAANAAVERQQAVVDALTAKRDALQAVYDRENKSLQTMQDQYDAINKQISDMQDALDGLTSAADKAGKSASDAADQFAALGDATNFPDPGGTGGIGPESGSLDDLMKQYENEAKNAFGKFDLLGPFKDMWKSIVKWIDDHTGGLATRFLTKFKDNMGASIASTGIGALIGGMLGGPIGLALGAAVGAIAGPSIAASLKKLDFSQVNKNIGNNKAWQSFGHGLQSVGDAFDWFAKKGEKIWREFGPGITKLLDTLGHSIGKLVGTVVKEFAKWSDVGQPLIKALQNLAKIAGALIMAIIFVIDAAWQFLWPIYNNVIKPFFDVIIKVVKGAMEVIHGIILIVLGLLTLNFSTFSKGVTDIFKGLWQAVQGIFEGAVKIVIGLVKGFVEGIVNFFKWLWDKLVGHSIVPDIINGIIYFFSLLIVIPKWILDHVLTPIYNAFAWAWNALIKPIVHAIVQGIQDEWHGLQALIKWLNDNIFTPIANAFNWLWNVMLKPVVNAMMRGMAGLGNAIGEGITRGVNVAIDAINLLANSINWIAGKLHLGFTIKTLGKLKWPTWSAPQFAEGGMLPGKKVGSGFITDKARAIVGEGDPRYPEYVIPTDPSHRGRAFDLYSKLGKDLGYGSLGKGLGLPHIPGTGIVKNAVGGAYNWTKDTVGKGLDDIITAGSKAAGYIRKGAIMAAMAGPLKAFDLINKLVPDSPYPFHSSANAWKNDIYNWLKGVDSKDRGSDWTDNIPALIGYQGPLGGAIADIIRLGGFGPRNVVTSAFRPGAGYHGTYNAVDFGFPGNDPAGLTPIAKYWEQYGPSLLELIYSGDGGHFWKNGKKVGWGFYGAQTESEHYNHVHVAATKQAIDALLGMRTGIADKKGLAMGGIMPWHIPNAVNGAMVLPRPGVGSLVRVGEGSQREAIIPLPPGDFGGGSRTITIDKLVLPNIRTPEDAEELLKNLESLGD